MNKVTVIVPIYNVEQYVRTCFDSLLKQTFEDFVVYAVNDGSPANEQSIIDEYVAKYPNKFVGIQKENGGYGSVLEMAISKCETPYFIICDPDDYLADDALEHLVDLAELSEADITIGAKYFIYSDGTDKDYDAAYNTAFTKLKVNTVYNSGTNEYNDLFYIDPSPHSKLYKKEVAKKIKFLHKVGYTDNLLFYISLLTASKVIYTDKACAYYLVDRAGNTMTDIRPKALDAHIEVFKTIVDQAQSLNPCDMFYYRMFESYKFILYQTPRMMGTKTEYKEKLDHLYEFVEKLIPHRSQIQPIYKKNAKGGFLEKYRDMQLLKSSSSKKTYAIIEEKMIQNFKEK
ncbi:glycosyltransferase family 2 protein [Anaerorhabdus furcosa]|uniref:Glycosyl transferase family 2 n=1 Tax=Anaerorhabdus furcosa TaxID=118967 RepID=A0A1T4LWK2_9FIRM|nr:glycosyltransferase family 2 protein [Anaerorhabdus furcosa]SJZ59065.1 Glycosyl transferase family 2 [Anaerorhabdus furcosa]